MTPSHLQHRKKRKKKLAKDSQLVVRINGQERDDFVSVCEQLDSSAAREIRKFIREFMKLHNKDSDWWVLGWPVALMWNQNRSPVSWRTKKLKSWRKKSKAVLRRSTNNARSSRKRSGRLRKLLNWKSSYLYIEPSHSGGSFALPLDFIDTKL